MLAALALAQPAQAGTRLAISAGSVESGGFVAAGVEVILAPAGDARLDATFYSRRIDGLESLGRLEGVRFTCARATLSAEVLECANGRLSGRFGAAGKQDAALNVSLAANGQLRARTSGLALAGGSVSLEGRLRDRDWSVQAGLDALHLRELASLAALREVLPPGLQADGMVSGTVAASGRGPRPGRVKAELGLSGIAFANEAGSLAGEALAGEVDLTVGQARGAGGWQVAARLRSSGGQAYLEPVFLDLDRHAVDAELDGQLAAGLDTLAIRNFSFRQAGVGRASGSLELDLAGAAGLRQARVQLESLELDGFASVYARPFLVATQFADIAGSGRISGQAALDAGQPSRLELDLEDVTLDSPGGSLAVEGLAGHFSWFAEGLRNELAREVDSALFKSQLAWRAARLWGIEFGPATLPFTTTGRNFRLLDPVQLPVFDGSLAIETLRIRHAATPQMYLRFDAELKPVSVALIGRALGWPEFSGSISGRIPRLELAEGLVTFGGNIEAEVFDGTVTLGGLRLRDPLGQHPQLFADVDVDRLDLERLTNTFEFGLITGRLSGRVAGLELFDWRPVSFDARFFSTPGDRSPRRISQRAVSNLSSIGGGSGGSVAAALQGGFLRFFKSFRYDRLGLSCRLANDICFMDGVAPAKAGYYIVKGSGLPRIDVIASQRRVAWTRLVGQLAAMIQSSGPVVE